MNTVHAIGKGNLVNGWTILDRLRDVEWEAKEYPQGSGPDRTVTRIWVCPTCKQDKVDGHLSDCTISYLIEEHERRAE